MKGCASWLELSLARKAAVPLTILGTPGLGIGGWISLVRLVRAGRRTAGKYLESRGLTRPDIPWDEIGALYDR